jgi:hypothetical protein
MSRTHEQTTANGSVQIPHGKRLLLGVEGVDTQDSVIELLSALLELLDASGGRVATFSPVNAGVLWAPATLGDVPFTVVAVKVEAR